MAKYHRHSNFIKEFASPLHGLGLKGITTNSDGNAWFYYSTNKTTTLIKFDPSSEKFSQYDVAGATTVHDFIIELAGGQLVFDKSRNVVWFTDSRTNSIGKFDVKSEKVELTAIPTQNAGPMGIALSPDGKNVWFAEITGNNIGQLHPESNKITEYFTGDNSGPTFLTFDEKGGLWVTLSYSHSILKVQPSLLDSDSSKGMSTIMLPNQEPFSPFGIAIVTDSTGKQRIFVSDHGSSRVISSPVDSDLKTLTSYWTSPSQEYPATLPGQIVSDKKGNVYFPEHGGNRIAKIDPAGLMTEYDIPTGPLSTAVFSTISDDRSRVWFTELLANRIAYLDTTIPVNFNLKVSGDNQLTLDKNGAKIVDISLISLDNKNNSFISLSNVALDLVGMTDLGLKGLTYDIQPQKIDLQKNPNVGSHFTLQVGDKARSGQYTVMARASSFEDDQQLAVSELYPILIKLDVSPLENDNSLPSAKSYDIKPWLHDLVNLLLIVLAIGLIGYLVYSKVIRSMKTKQKEL
ncbi:MAG: hypothetical protein HY295_02920 [Thaumarchaeota archaeon]|nr:hypothetical protein [Nitrososphaerota archaeon]